MYEGDSFLSDTVAFWLTAVFKGTAIYLVIAAVCWYGIAVPIRRRKQAAMARAEAGGYIHLLAERHRPSVGK
jgi:hypothetical protein